MIQLTLTEQEKICPLCGRPNNCQHGEGGGSCWCETVKIPKYILDKIPDDKKGKVCICKSCIEKYAKK